jgi:hypothetical protein
MVPFTEVAAAIAWSQQRFSFWGPFVLSGRKLREKFDTIAGHMIPIRTGIFVRRFAGSLEFNCAANWP